MPLFVKNNFLLKKEDEKERGGVNISILKTLITFSSQQINCF